MSQKSGISLFINLGMGFVPSILRFFGRQTWILGILRVKFPRGCNCLEWFVRLGLSVAGGADKQLGEPSKKKSVGNINRGEGVKEF